MTFVSVIIATYNWPEALHLCLESLRNQTVNNYEILIADDGSKENTQVLI
ncbi:MAG: glycosyltransferase, partial [Burkholderiaceae bacterium]|nr:glycosyltransferase [Burkholderiaceae bacterium]